MSHTELCAEKRPPDAHCTPTALSFHPLHVNTNAVHCKQRGREALNASPPKNPTGKKKTYPNTEPWIKNLTSTQSFHTYHHSKDALFDYSIPMAPSSVNTVKEMSGGPLSALTFVTGAEAELDREEQQQPHVHIEKRDGHSSTCEGELAGKLPAHSYFPKARLLLQKQGRILLIQSTGSAMRRVDAGGWANPCGSAVAYAPVGYCRKRLYQ